MKNGYILNTTALCNEPILDISKKTKSHPSCILHFLNIYHNDFLKNAYLFLLFLKLDFFCRKECCSKSQRGNSNGRYKILHIYVYEKDISKRVPKRIDKALHGLQQIRQWCMWNGVSCISSKRWEKSRHQRVSSLLTIQIYFYFSEDIGQLKENK